ncbi:MAG: DUF3656 domain-containing protein [Oscillospiraceae bacterium]
MAAIMAIPAELPVVELLSPAGSPEALRAAVQNGADAVYLGYGDFNARQNAKNFSAAEFEEGIRYCHLRGVKVYLTLNTLVTDRELSAAAAVAGEASALGIDAILVQDFGLFTLLRETIPDCPLHASTQMSLMTSGGAVAAAELGCTRVVLARELSKFEIAKICNTSPAEIEVFVHGALCMCYSGQCAMSAFLGGRSGNRGTCAQPCRLPYGVNAPLAGRLTYPLSLKDSCLADALAALSDMGVACLKIEGRMKRPEYVAVVTGIYAALLREHRPPTEEERRQLADAFSRDGFTDGYYSNKQGKTMFGTRPEDAAEPRELFAAAKAAYDKENLRLVPITLSCTMEADRPATLTVWDSDGHSVTVQGAIPEAARSHALTAEEVETRLRKTGGTAFSCDGVTVTVDGGLSLSASALNGLRREGLDALAALRQTPPTRRALPAGETLRVPNPAAPYRFTCSIAKPEQLTQALLDCHPARVYLPLELIARCPLETLSGDTEFVAILPRIWRDTDEPLLQELWQAANARGVTAVLLSNLGQLGFTEAWTAKRYGDFGFNVFNSRSLDFLRQRGLSSATLSFELMSGQIRDLSKALPVEAIVYGRLPLQITENCPVKNSGGCKKNEDNFLSDRTGARFPLLCAFGCRSELQNSKLLWLADSDSLSGLGLSFARLRFTTEAPEDCVRVFHSYLRGDPPPAEFTRGRYGATAVKKS